MTTSKLTKPPSSSVDPIQAILAERGGRYGDFSQHANIADDLLDVMQECTNTKGEVAWKMLRPFQRQALRTIADKIARILNGDPDYNDNWVDIQGYARLVEERLPKS